MYKTRNPNVEIGNTKEYIDQIRSLGVFVGISLNPDTPFSAIEEFLSYVDIVLFMSVYPGFGGQSFIPEVLEKVEKANQYRIENNLDLVLQIDGGINKETISVAAKSGIDVFVAGNAVFNSPDPAAEINRLEDIARQA